MRLSARHDLVTKSIGVQGPKEMDRRPVAMRATHANADSFRICLGGALVLSSNYSAASQRIQKTALQ